MKVKVSGHVRQRANGRWEFSLPMGYDLNGKKRRITKSGFATKEEAQAALIQMGHGTGQHMLVKPSEELVFNYLRSWIDQEGYNYCASTRKNFNRYLNNYISPEFGNLKLNKLTTGHIQRLYYVLISKGLSPQTVKKVHHMLSKAMEKAIALEMLQTNPVKKATIPKKNYVHEHDVWTKEELAHFLSIAKSSRWYIAFLLEACTGARQGEILALRWKDIDFQTNRLTIRRSIVVNDVGYKLSDPKTKKGTRSMVLPLQVMDELKRHRDCLYEDEARIFNKRDDFLVRTRKGNMVNPRNFSREWYKLRDMSGLPKIRFHDLRHTHATILLQSGINVKAVQERLGHKKSEITLDIYSHVTPRMEEGVVDVLDSMQLLN